MLGCCQHPAAAGAGLAGQVTHSFGPLLAWWAWWAGEAPPTRGVDDIGAIEHILRV